MPRTQTHKHRERLWVDIKCKNKSNLTRTTTSNDRKKKTKEQNSTFSFVGFVCSSVQISRPPHEADKAMDCVETETDYNNTKYQFNIYDYRFTWDFRNSEYLRIRVHLLLLHLFTFLLLSIRIVSRVWVRAYVCVFCYECDGGNVLDFLSSSSKLSSISTIWIVQSTEEWISLLTFLFAFFCTNDTTTKSLPFVSLRFGFYLFTTHSESLIHREKERRSARQAKWGREIKLKVCVVHNRGRFWTEWNGIKKKEQYYCYD